MILFQKHLILCCLRRNIIVRPRKMLVTLVVESHDWLCTLAFKEEVSKEQCHDSGLAVSKRTDHYPVLSCGKLSRNIICHSCK